MQSHITKWGNSLALRLPKHMASDAQLREGTVVDLHVEGDALIVRPSRPKYKLGDLLSGHRAQREGDVDWGKAEGEEVW